MLLLQFSLTQNWYKRVSLICGTASLSHVRAAVLFTPSYLSDVHSPDHARKDYLASWVCLMADGRPSALSKY